MSWPALLSHYKLHLDASDFIFVGRWVTPPFSARRFDTWFFLVNCPAKQEPQVIPGELESGEWITARTAYDAWQQSKVLAVPPTLQLPGSVKSVLPATGCQSKAPTTLVLVTLMVAAPDRADVSVTVMVI